MDEARKGEIALLIYRSGLRKLFLDDSLRNIIINKAVNARKNGDPSVSREQAWGDEARNLSIMTGVEFGEMLKFVLEQSELVFSEVSGFIEEASDEVNNIINKLRKGD